MFTYLLLTIYLFLKHFNVKIGFSQPGAVKFFIDLMTNAVRYREESKETRLDYLDHLINLRNKKQISGEFLVFFLAQKFQSQIGLEFAMATHSAT